jgi:hypothetical protein
MASGAMQAGEAGATRAQSKEMAEKAYREWLALTVPDPREQQLKLERYQQTGTFDPEFEEAVTMGPSAYEGVQEDPRLREAQLGALSSLENIGERGGRTLDQDAYLQKVKNDANSADRGRRLAIQQNMAARGMGNVSGLEMAAKLDSAGTAADRESDASLQASRDAQLNALSAIEKSGTLAGGIRDDDYRRSSGVASARDSVSQFNANMLSGVRQRNNQTANAAKLTNLQEKQRVADQNVGLSNEEQAHNKGLIQQKYENELQKASGASNALSGASNNLAKLSGQQSTSANNWMQGGVKAGASAYDAYLKSNDKSESGEVKTGRETTTSDNEGYGYQDDDEGMYA